MSHLALKTLCTWIGFGVAASLTPPVARAAPPALPDDSMVKLSLPLAEARPLGEQEAGNRPILRVTLKDGKVVDLPMSADTWFWKNEDKSHADDGGLMLRDNKWAQALLKPDLAALPPGAEIDKAALRVFGTYREKPGSVALAVHRMATAWAEAATFVQAVPAGKKWNGMKPGEDYEATPAATWKTNEFTPNTPILIEGLETLVRGWQSGAFAKQGMALLMNGRAIQIGIASREAKPKSEPPLTIGGPDDLKALLRPDAALLSRVLLRPGDLRQSALRLHIAKMPQDSRGVTLTLHRALKPMPHGVPVAGTDYEAQPLASAPLDTAQNGDLLIPLPAHAANAPFGLIAGLQAANPRPTLTFAPRSDAKARPALDITFVKHPNALLFDHEVKPKAGVYAILRDGHLFYGGQRLRLWGIVGNGDPDRLRKMGFNAQRVWNPTSQVGGGTSEVGAREFYSAESARKGEAAPFQKGDGSKLDGADRHFADLKEHGMFVMFAALTGILPIEPVLAEDSFIAGGEDWAAWKAAVSAARDKAAVARSAIYFDERFQRLKKRHAANLLNHLNPYTGKKYGEDEAVAVYEVWNEQGFLKKTLENGLNLPPYFGDKARGQWNEWLARRYTDDAGLKAAWGELKDGESLAQRNVKMAPIVRERGAYPKARAADYVRFLSEKVEAFQRDFVAHCRRQAPAGVGVNVAPFSFDTQYQPSIQWPFSKSVSEVNSFGMYFWDVNSQLGKPPSMYVIDANRVEGKATILYETNASRPGPYRAEYPLRLAALASWQDFDGVFWHYWQGNDHKSDEAALAGAMPYPNNDFIWTGVHHEADPAMTSSMAVAGRIFLSGAIAPAPHPVTFRIGKDGLYSLDLVNGVDARAATFARGSQIRFEPEADFKLKQEGDVPPQSEGRVKGGDEIVWDYANSRLIVDTPTAKIYAGKTMPAGYRFKDGIALSGFSSPFIAWAIVSGDGKPLVGPNATKRAFVTGQFDAQNSGFAFDWTVAGGPDRQAKAIKNRGRAPVVVDKVDYTLSFPVRLDYSFAGYDFALRRNVAQDAQNSNVLRVRDHEIWMGALDITRRGAAAATLVETGTPRPTLAQVTGAAVRSESDPRLRTAFNPLPGLSWGDNYAQAHKTLRDAAFVKTGVSREAQTPGADETITLTEAEVLLATPADIDVRFTGGAMRSITATFKRPPVLTETAATLEKQFGAPLEKRITGDQTKADVVRWLVKGERGDVEIALSASQGIVRLVYTLQPKG